MHKLFGGCQEPESADPQMGPKSTPFWTRKWTPRRTGLWRKHFVFIGFTCIWAPGKGSVFDHFLGPLWGPFLGQAAFRTYRESLCAGPAGPALDLLLCINLFRAFRTYEKVYAPAQRGRSWTYYLCINSFRHSGLMEKFTRPLPWGRPRTYYYA